MAAEARMDVEDDDAAAAASATVARTSGVGAGTSGAPTQTTPPQEEREGGNSAEMNIINTLEVDPSRADNDSSLGSDISSCVSTSSA